MFRSNLRCSWRGSSFFFCWYWLSMLNFNFPLLILCRNTTYSNNMVTGLNINRNNYNYYVIIVSIMSSASYIWLPFFSPCRLTRITIHMRLADFIYIMFIVYFIILFFYSHDYDINFESVSYMKLLPGSKVTADYKGACISARCKCRLTCTVWNSCSYNE